MSDEAERTLCQLPHVHVFRIPVRKSAEGHRASDWPKDPTWTGKLKIVAKGKVAAIILMDASNQVFALCQVTDDAAVERTLDSGRYFVLRITNAQGRHAFIGIAFNERNDAFDFNVALNEFKNELEREELANKLSSDVPVGPMKDMSLKEGEKIKIKINRKKPTTTEEDEAFSGASFTPAPAAKPTGGLLAPPKGMLSPPPNKSAFPSGASTASTVSRTSSNASNSSTNSGFDDFSSFGSDPFATSSPSNAAHSSSTSIFGFDSSDPFASSGPNSATKLAAPSSDPFAGSDPFGFTPTGASTPIKPLPAATAASTPKSNHAQSDVGNLLDF